MVTNFRPIALSTLFLALAPSCAEPVADEYSKFQTRISELSLEDGTYEVLIEPSILATDAIIVYSEPSHQAVAAAFDHSFSGTETGTAMIEHFTENSDVLMKVDMKIGAFGIQIVSPPAQHELYSFEIWGRSPEGLQFSGILAEEETEQLHSFSVEELREHDANRSEDQLTERAISCCICGGMNCGCLDCGLTKKFFCNCVQCEAHCDVIITNPTSAT